MTQTDGTDERAPAMQAPHSMEQLRDDRIVAAETMHATSEVAGGVIGGLVGMFGPGLVSTVLLDIIHELVGVPQDIPTPVFVVMIGLPILAVAIGTPLGAIYGRRIAKSLRLRSTRAVEEPHRASLPGRASGAEGSSTGVPVRLEADRS